MKRNVGKIKRKKEEQIGRLDTKRRQEGGKKKELEKRYRYKVEKEVRKEGN